MEYMNINLQMATDEQRRTLQEQMDCVERLIQSCAVPTFVIDSQHRVILWNKACEALTGVMAAQVIAADDLEKVFEIFRRAGRQDVSGEGVGLAHAKTLVRRQGGRMIRGTSCLSRRTFSETISNLGLFLSTVKTPDE
jgi:PAS domain-containing protein